MPILNRAVENGYGPPEGSPLQKWHAKIKQRPAVAETFAEYKEVAKKMSGMKDAFQSGTFRREYRDHRLEFLVKYVPFVITYRKRVMLTPIAVGQVGSMSY